MNENLNSGYGDGIKNTINFTTGKTFFVVAQDDVASNEKIQSLFRPDTDGSLRAFPTVALAIASCLAGRGDQIILSPSWSAVFSASELLEAEVKGVTVIPAGLNRNDLWIVRRPTGALPATATGILFTVTGRVKLVTITGIVTTAIQNQANNTKLLITPTVGAVVDICAVASTANLAVGTQLAITGTFATALQISASAVQIYQATSIIVPAGTIGLNTLATNTGSIKWSVEYVPIDPGAKIISA